MMAVSTITDIEFEIIFSHEYSVNVERKRTSMLFIVGHLLDQCLLLNILSCNVKVFYLGSTLRLLGTPSLRLATSTYINTTH